MGGIFPYRRACPPDGQQGNQAKGVKTNQNNQKGGVKTFTKLGKPKFAAKKPEYTIAQGVTLPENTHMVLTCVDREFFNSKVMTLGSYVGNGGKQIVEGDLVAKCKWKLNNIVILNKEGKEVKYPLKGNVCTLTHEFVPYIVQYKMEKTLDGRINPILYVLTPDHEDFKKVKSVTLKPSGEITGTITVRKSEKEPNKEKTTRHLVKLNKADVTTLQDIKKQNKLDSISESIRHLIRNYREN